MNENTLQFDRNLTVPYVDQWFGTWFIEPQRGQALHSIVRQLNLSVHLQTRQEAAAEAPVPAQQQPNSVPIDYESPPPTRRAYGYRIIDGVAILEISGTLMKHEASM